MPTKKELLYDHIIPWSFLVVIAIVVGWLAPAWWWGLAAIVGIYVLMMAGLLLTMWLGHKIWQRMG